MTGSLRPSHALYKLLVNTQFIERNRQEVYTPSLVETAHVAVAFVESGH